MVRRDTAGSATLSTPCWFEVCQTVDCGHERQEHLMGSSVDPECNEGACTAYGKEPCACTKFVK